ncbi:MAG: DUF5610 domain-containing protein [Candidatus Hydrogenedentes bacterium]|nr:DUF5610 domain-containing protein [Candidatus Hydrogenedentota bacterium]
MVASVSSVQSSYNIFYQSTKTSSTSSYVQDNTGAADKLDLGQSGPLTTEQAISIVTERSISKLQAVVSDARASLGLSEDSPLDVSPEATANRIADFALNFFDKYLEKHPEVSGDDAKKQFAEFIGGAIGQGIEEARGILGALSALNPDVDNHINSIADLIQKRLDDFVSGTSQA